MKEASRFVWETRSHQLNWWGYDLGLILQASQVDLIGVPERVELPDDIRLMVIVEWETSHPHAGVAFKIGTSNRNTPKICKKKHGKTVKDQSELSSLTGCAEQTPESTRLKQEKHGVREIFNERLHLGNHKEDRKSKHFTKNSTKKKKESSIETATSEAQSVHKSNTPTDSALMPSTLRKKTPRISK